MFVEIYRDYFIARKLSQTHQTGSKTTIFSGTLKADVSVS